MSTADDAARSDLFTVMTFNLLMVNRGFTGAAGSIVSQAPGVVAVQELSHQAAEALAAHLRRAYPHQALRPDPRAVAGGGVFSRYPILEEEPFRLSARGHTCQRLVLDVDGRRVNFFNIHLKAPSIRLRSPRYDSEEREKEAAALEARLREHGEALVVVGDFNMTDRSESYRRLAGLLHDSFREAGTGPANTFPNAARLGPLRVPLWPAPFPMIRIDYVFHSPDLEAREAHRGDGDGSDHCPVIVTLAFRG